MREFVIARPAGEPVRRTDFSRVLPSCFTRIPPEGGTMNPTMPTTETIPPTASESSASRRWRSWLRRALSGRNPSSRHSAEGMRWQSRQRCVCCRRETVGSPRCESNTPSLDRTGRRDRSSGRAVAGGRRIREDQRHELPRFHQIRGRLPAVSRQPARRSGKSVRSRGKLPHEIGVVAENVSDFLLKLRIVGVLRRSSLLLNKLTGDSKDLYLLFVWKLSELFDDFRGTHGKTVSHLRLPRKPYPGRTREDREDREELNHAQDRQG